MYEPSHFKVEDISKLHGVMQDQPLGLLVTSGAQGLLANAIPFMLHPELGEKGVLRAHMARANPQWRDLAEGAEALVVFQGADRYISPGWYASKQEHGRVVPTWNYVMVQVRGASTVHPGADWLRPQITEMTDVHEHNNNQPWKVADAPEKFVTAQMQAIMGVQIAISDLRGKFKVSQNRSPADRLTVLAALEASEQAGDLEMAALLRSNMAES